MKEIHYMISDAAKKVDVESHVLRYWEDELGLQVARNEMGHRYYTEEDITMFQNVKCLKEQGFQLKAIKLLLPELTRKDPAVISNLLLLREELNQRVDELDANQREVAVSLDQTPDEQKLTQFKQIVEEAVREVVEENNQKLAREMSRHVSRDLSEDMEGLFRDREQRDEERFRQLDNSIRQRQKGCREVAVTQADRKIGRLFKRKEPRSNSLFKKKQ